MGNKDMTLEQAFENLDDIIEKMSEENVPLEKSFELYNQGIKLVKMCGDKIEKVEKQIEILDKGDETDEL